MSRCQSFIKGFCMAAAIALLMTGCRCPKDIQTIIDTTAVHDTTIDIVYDTLIVIKEVHDTTEKYIHDTTMLLDIKQDSIDRYVERTTYIDSNGVWHENRIEHVTHYIYRESSKYKAKEAEYKRTISDMEQQYSSTVSEYEHKVSELEKQIHEQQSVVEVKKPLTWWQKTFIWVGVISLIGVVVSLLWKYRKLIKI